MLKQTVGYFKQMYAVPTSLEIATRDLEEAKRSLLDSQASAEHAQKMSEFYQGLIKRLNKYIQDETKEQNKEVVNG